ncbi:polymorphic toxin-type HINT domain-containing protein [Paenibacillus daejeonensis]|uniref:polymorphic toxin-type HINT domain-containing protein n=1 Tax=Paenibacillus daejeonensis TaxID=135193 RepID=UPI000377C88E|nr:polymorphic toxin-type HINT domain-containing protein [Paenibacillus daejeonensis]
MAYKEVTSLYRNQRDDIIILSVGEKIIETTDNHPFWVEDKGWIYADELKVGDNLQKADGSNLTIEKIEFVKLDEPVTVYNFTVDDYHTYYVTDLGIWVHNTKCPWMTVVEEKNVTNQLKSLSAKQQKSFDEITTKLANGDHSGLNVHLLTGSGDKKGLWSADFKGFGGGRGNARIYFKMENGKITITEIDLKHQK